MVISLQDRNRGSVSRFSTEPFKSIPFPGNNGEFKIRDLKSDFMNTGAAVLISAKTDEGGEITFWVFEHPEKARALLPEPMRVSPRFNASAIEPYTFGLESVEMKYYTGLQANRDPGVSAVWSGFITMIAGFFFTFFSSHKRIWARMRRQGESTKIDIGGRASKNPIGLEKEIKGMMEALKTALEDDRG
jgi:cytochrome c biogenesis protein